MKKLILITVLLISTVAISFAQRTQLIGKCKFYYEGNAPKYTTSTGSMKVYHNGDLKKNFIEGKYDYWSCTGTVWVIFYSKDAAERNKFIGGNVQTCNNF